MATDPDFHIKPRRAALNHAPRVDTVHRLRRQCAGATGCRTEERAFGPSPIPTVSITYRGSVPGCDLPAFRGAWFVPKSMRLQPERSCWSVRRLHAVHRTDRAVSVTPGDDVGGTFRVWRRRPGATCPLWGITRRPCRPCGAAGLGGQQLFNGFPSIERFLARNHSTSAAHRASLQEAARNSSDLRVGMVDGPVALGAMPLPKTANDVSALRVMTTRREFVGGATALVASPNAMPACDRAATDPI